jgi:hypothetical protein
MELCMNMRAPSSSDGEKNRSNQAKAFDAFAQRRVVTQASLGAARLHRRR